MPDNRRRQRNPQRQRQVADEPVIHEAPPFEPPPHLRPFANPLVYVPIAIGASLLLVLIAFLIRDGDDDDDAPDVVAPIETPTTTAEPTPEGTPTPDPRSFESAEDVVDEAAFDYRATITTDAGVIEIDLFADVVPRTVNNFVFLAQNGFYDGLTWHEVVPNFVARAGDPRYEAGEEFVEDDPDGPGYTTPQESNDLANTRGTVSMDKPDGATAFGSQFFINLKDNPALDEENAEGGDAFYPFGEVVEGLEVIDAIEEGDVIESITISETPRSEGDDSEEDEAGEG